MSGSDKIALVALIVSVVTLLQSIYFWRKSFRPIVTAMVKTRAGGNVSIAFNLVVQNSGSIPARNITLHVHDRRALEASLDNAPDDWRASYLACFDKATVIPILQNGAEVSCSFGHTSARDGFWKPSASFPIVVRYQGWFGRVYVGHQTIKIADSESFTGMAWGASKTS